MDSERILTSTCSSVNTLELVLSGHRLGRNRSPFRTCCARLQNPVCSVLEVVISVRHYGSDRSCYLPELNLVNEAVLVRVVVLHYLLLCSLRVARILCHRLVFLSLVVFPITSNSVKSGSGPEHWSFEPDSNVIYLLL